LTPTKPGNAALRRDGRGERDTHRRGRGFAAGPDSPDGGSRQSPRGDVMGRELSTPGPGRVSRIVRGSVGSGRGLSGTHRTPTPLPRDGHPSPSAVPRDGSGCLLGRRNPGAAHRRPAPPGEGSIDSVASDTGCGSPAGDDRSTALHREAPEGRPPSRRGPQEDFDAGPTSISRWWVPPTTSTSYDDDMKMSSTSPDVWTEAVS
jgi:hypothetical protein